MKPLILIAEDTETNIDLLVEALGQEYDINIAMDGRAALESVDAVVPDLILLDIMMPEMDGYQVCEQLKQNEKTRQIPIIFLTALNDDHDESRGLTMGAVDYIAKPFNPFLLRARIKNHIQLKQYRDHLETMVEQRTQELEKTQEVTMISMGTLAEYRDPETGGHIKRTQHYVRLLAVRLKENPKFADELTDSRIRSIYKSAPLHDIGKVGVPDHILLKPGKLSSEEFEEMKQHALYGSNTIQIAEKELGNTKTFLRHARDIAYGHHEKWDGTGYPRAISGEQIPLSARLMAVGDVYDALISKRVYKPAFSHEQAVNIIQKGRGTHFDPDVVDVFLEITEEFRKTAIRFADSDAQRKLLETGD